jgi:hypothetical protein
MNNKINFSYHLSTTKQTMAFSFPFFFSFAGSRGSFRVCNHFSEFGLCTIETIFLFFFDRIDDSPENKKQMHEKMESPTHFHVNNLLTPNFSYSVFPICLFRDCLSAGVLGKVGNANNRDVFK